jgi:hypothetical protein
LAVASIEIEDSKDPMPTRTWLLEVFHVMARDDKSLAVQHQAVLRAERVTRRSFAPPDPKAHSQEAYVKLLRKNFLAWWEREGKAKYGRGGQ